MSIGLLGTRSSWNHHARRSSPFAERPRLRVLVMPAWYPWPDRPVYATFCREQAHVAALAHDVVVVTWLADERLERLFSVHLEEDDGVPTYRVRFCPSGAPKLGFVAKMCGIFTVLARLRRSNRWSPDVIHAHEYEAGLPATIVAAATRAPLVITEHSSAVALGQLEPKQSATARRAFRRADVICPVSEDLGRRLIELAGRTPIVPVPNAVNDELFRLRADSTRQSSFARPEVKLLTVGNLVQIKGHSHLLKALAQLRASGIPAKLEIVGDGLLREELKAQASQLGVSPYVVFHGALSREGVARIMSMVDIFVLPSLWETLGCALIEAMASGCPAVATNVGGVPEVLDQRAGVLVSPGSSEALAAGILEVLSCLSDYRPEVLRALAVDRFGYATVSRLWSGVYRSVLSSRNRSRRVLSDAR